VRAGGASALVATGLALGLTTALVGCSEQGDDYCAEVKEHQVALSDIAASGEKGALFDALDVYRRLQAEAPADLSDEWSQVIGRLSALRDAVEAAGVDPSTYDPQDPPGDVSAAERRAIRGAARDLAEPSVAEAMEGIEQQALDVCKTPLSR
jgi:hypothetical protein